jgi:hypothetical protein
VVVVDPRTVIYISLTTPLEKDAPADWEILSKSLKVKAGLINQ